MLCFLNNGMLRASVVSTNGKTVLPIILSMSGTRHQVTLYEGTMYRGDTLRLGIKLPPDPFSGIYIKLSDSFIKVFTEPSKPQ